MVLTESVQKLKKGDKAPDFSLKGVDDKIYSLKDFEGLPAPLRGQAQAGKQGLLVIFMCNHCPYVRAKLPVIAELYKKWGTRISFCGINSNDSGYEGEGMDNMKVFAKERAIAFPYLFDTLQDVAKAYGATCTPDPFLFNKNSELVFHGRIDDATGPGETAKEKTMDENISKMLSGQEISDEFKPSMGCSIKWTP
ncbi:MAG: alkyl hydroperoxide reductase [Parcubacteria group bacterium Gr01-1014_30]|nr:MAG: alkyl hydroperoxide reductase [Parcubacteria group bacterium Gr01-1014_30]